MAYFNDRKKRPLVGPGTGGGGPRPLRRRNAVNSNRPIIGRRPNPRLNRRPGVSQGPSVRPASMTRSNRRSPGYGGPRTMRTPGIGNTLTGRKRRGY